MGNLLGPSAFVERLCPEGMRYGFTNPFDEALAEEFGGDEAPVGPGPVAAALDHRGDARALLDGGGVGKALSVLAEGSEESWGQCGARARQGCEDLEVGQLGTAVGDSGVEVSNGTTRRSYPPRPSGSRCAVFG